MKQLYYALPLFISLSAFASTVNQKAMIIVLECPVFKLPDFRSPVVQSYRKGDLVYIHPKHFSRPLEGDFDSSEELLFGLDEKKQEIHAEDIQYEQYYRSSASSDFYTTLDRLGKEAYIPKKFVKLITGDEREQQQSVAYEGADPTDYRLPEPLPERYPLASAFKYRTTVALGLGTPSKFSYPYTSPIASQEFGRSFELQAKFGYKVNTDRLERIYFGAMIHFSTAKNQFQLASSTEVSAQEKSTQLGIGPYWSFDPYSDKKYRLSTYLGVPVFLINQVSIKTDGVSDNRKFSKMTLGPQIGVALKKRRAMQNNDLFLGFSAQFILPHTKQSDDPYGASTVFRPQIQDEMKHGLESRLMLLVGVQSTSMQSVLFE